MSSGLFRDELMPDTLLYLRMINRRNATSEASRSDAELLGRFVRFRDQGAFEQLLARHGAMMWGVCRRVLGMGAPFRLRTKNMGPI